MKIFIITHEKKGLAAAWLALDALKNTALTHNFTITNILSDADLVIIAGKDTYTDNALIGKKVYFSDIEHAIQNPIQYLNQAQAQATIYTPKVQLIKTSPPLSVLAVTACPTGIAHTYMAAEALETEGKKRGWHIKVETHGSVGIKNEITADEIIKADLVIIAADIKVNIDKFSGKQMYRTSTSLALKKTVQEMDKAQKEASTFILKNNQFSYEETKNETHSIYRHLLTGVSYMLPMVIAGGLCTTLSYAFNIHASKIEYSLSLALNLIGNSTALFLIVPVLSSYIAYSISDRMGLTPGLVGGVLATTLGSGFIGGIASGFIAGYSAHFINTQIQLPKIISALKPILIIPLMSTLFTGLMMIYLIGNPASWLMQWLTDWLNIIGETNSIILGALLGAMMCTDIGGPVNKAAYAFGVGLLSTKNYMPIAAIMGAGMVPPLAMGISTILARYKFMPEEHEAGKTSLLLGLCFISEGAIPFAAKDPIRVLPVCIIGGSITGALSMYFNAQLTAPHGGLFVLFIPGAINHILMYLLAIVTGTIISGVLYAILKNKCVEKEKIINLTS
ncbi:PTS system fructose-specific EIIB'BC component [Candidatus Hartigia pinicola]|nr:PTS system fructose-specific EIIB'BC component [Candidatus Hartigia pinicola]